MFNFRYLFFLLLIASIGCGKPKVVNLDLKALNWSLSSVSDSIAVDSAITDDVHLALIDKGVIPDPFFRDNEKHVQWVGQTAWVYETTFDLPSDLLTDKGLDLVFEGLDTYTRIVLNGHTIAETNNMFRSYRFPVEKWLIKKDNALSVTFFPPEVINDRKEALYGILLPEKRGFSRKAPYQFGWDWGPKLVTMGLWKPARIESRKALELVDVFVDQLFVSDSVVDLLVISSVRSEMKTSVELHVSVDGSEVKRVPVELSAGDTILSIPLRVYDLPLWYPIGLGKASRVKVQVEIVQDNIKESKSVDIGLRSIKLVDKEDAAGTGFVFVVNGHEVYVKGANYIPQDNFLSRVTREQTRDLLVMAQKSNMNMLRVWGGGAYETDDFYTLCDSLGLMVWQDFMFAGTVYPGDSAFLQNVTLEAEQQIIRLRNHPSIALWCGNNEVDEAWHNWGWQKSLGYSENDSSKLWNDYLLLFEDILPEKVKELDPQISYVPSSPANGWGRSKAYTEGDVHYWGVWWGAEPFESYKTHVGRFVSEYGFQGLPDLKTIEEFTLPDDRNTESEVMAAHQKHPRGKALIEEYMARDFCVPKAFDDYVYVSQMLQAYGIKMAIEAHRQSKPYNMGTLYWQLNDCWSVTSWSGIDYQHRWKAMQYAVRKAYDRFLVVVTEDGNEPIINVVSDCLIDRNPHVYWYLLSFDGDTLAIGRRQIELPAGVVTRFNCTEITHLIASQEFRQLVLLKVQLIDNQELLAESLQYFVRPNELLLPKNPQVELVAVVNPDSVNLVVTATKLAKGVHLTAEIPGWFSDNYFDVSPGDSVRVVFYPESQVPKAEHFKIAHIYNDVCR